LASLHDAITSQTGISSRDQFVLFENHALRDVMDAVVDDISLSAFLHTSPSNPLYLFSVSDCVEDASAVLPPDSVLSATIRKCTSHNF